MNRDHLGDALDHWKGSLFESLQKARVLKDFAVDPLASDLCDWEPQDFDLYARLLKVKLRQVLLHTRGIDDNRDQYFGEISHAGDLFIDPDTGVTTGRVTTKHIRPAEIGRLLNSARKRIVAVYQHAARGRQIENRVNEVVTAIRRECEEVQWSFYNAGTVAMLFLTRDCGRADTVSSHFRRFLGPSADWRIGQGG
jgi:hypothetical protein